MVSEIDWDLLGETNLKVAWRLVANLLGKDCFPGMLAVPNIEEANFFDLMMCFMEDDQLDLNGNEFKICGHVVDVARVYEEDGFPCTNMSELLYACSHLPNEELEITSKRSYWSHDDKTILIEMSGLTKRIIDWTNFSEGSLVVDKTVSGLKSIYIISEVIYADYLKVEVNVGGFTLSDEIKKSIPVAFKYKKFAVNSLGVLKAETTFKELHLDAFFHLVGEPDINLGLVQGGKLEPVSAGTRFNSEELLTSDL